MGYSKDEIINFAKPSRQYLRDFDWIQSHIDQLAQAYPNQWVAVHRGKVVAVGDELGKVKAKVHEKVGEKEVPVYFVDDGTIILGV